MEIDASTRKREDASASPRPHSRKLDILSAIILGAAALATTYASYQAELWDGEQSAHYTKANTFRVESSQASLRAGQLEGVDLMTFGSWLSAYSSGNEELQDFYARRFRQEFAPVFNEWVALRPRVNPQAPPTPFAMSSYTLQEREDANILEQRAQEAFAAGEDANAKGDKFVLATVILANALFFGGVNQLPHSLRTRKILLGLAVVFCVIGIAFMAVLPPAP